MVASAFARSCARRLDVLAVGLAIGSFAGLGCGANQPWLHSCAWSLAASRAATVHSQDDGLVFRLPQRTVRVPWTGCLATNAGSRRVVALAGGRSALVVSYESFSGNWIESGRLHSVVACMVDPQKGTWPIDASLLGDPRSFSPTVGAHTGFLYDASGRSARVIDLARGTSERLPGNAVAFNETSGRVRMVARDTGSEAPAGRPRVTSLVISDYDATAWPPTLLEKTFLSVDGIVHHVVLSSDSRWIAFSGHDDRSKRGMVGVHDTQRSRKGFVAQGPADYMLVADVVSRGDHAWLLVGQGTSAGATSASWVNDMGERIAPSVPVHPTTFMKWIPAERRVLVQADPCNAHLVDLPLPGGEGP